MEKYNYFEAVKNAVLDYINENEIKVTTSNKDELAGIDEDEIPYSSCCAIGPANWKAA